ncbi:MAG: beta-galactosidase [Bryobacterales bacterium]|nr:beta-galactosidase [Bryobacterales bacterium]
MRYLSILLLLFAASLCAAQLELPGDAFERDAAVTVVFRTAPQAIGKGELHILWTDALGRTVEDRRIPVELNDETEIRFDLDMRHAVTMANQLHAEFRFEGKNRKDAPDRRNETASASFVAKPPTRHWDDYTIMMWQTHNAERLAVLKQFGINAAQYGGKAAGPPEAMLKNNFRWYAENIATDFYSEYHRFRNDRVPQWSYLQAKELYRKDPTSLEAFKRHPSLSDPAWLAKIHDRLVEAARKWAPYRPVFYDLGDESGIADLAAYWDFDFSDYSLDGMRLWLKERYGTLDALNRQWGSSFDTWEHVIPNTTREAMARTDNNYSSWSDHKEWMDIAFASAIRMGVDAVRSVDPDAYVGIAGAQMPGWGGYDYWRLSQVLTAVEPYDIGNNIEIIRSLNPALPFITTSFAQGDRERHRIWYELLHGARGHIIWDDKNDGFATRDAKPAGRGLEVEGYYNEIRNGLGALLIASQRQEDPIAIHYSQPSMRTEWMLAQRPHGEAWVDRTSAKERMDSDFLRLRESWCKIVEDLGLQYNFVAYEQIERGELARKGYRVLILPRSTSLSEAEAREIRAFAEAGGLVIADGVPGRYDEHSRLLAKPRLEGAAMASVSALPYYQQRLLGKEGELHESARKIFDAQNLRPRFAVTGTDGKPVVGVETHVFRNGAATIVGLLTNPQLRVHELGPPEFKSNERFESSREVRLRLPAEMYVYDVRAAKSLGRAKELAVHLVPFDPAIYALTPEPVPALRVVAPARASRGSVVDLSLAFDGVAPAEKQVFHVEVRNPSGELQYTYSGNVVATGGVASKQLPLALNDPAGAWEIKVKDVLSGQERTLKLEVQ